MRERWESELKGKPGNPESDISTTRIYLGLGSNRGNRLLNLKKALNLLRKAGIQIIKVSSVYKSMPVDYLNQPDFFNVVVEAETDLNPNRVLRVIQEIESSLGRKRKIPKGPRTIDIDILLYGKDTIASKDLIIPHPRMRKRSFVLVPLLEIAPQVRFPSGELVKESLKGLKIKAGEINNLGRFSEIRGGSLR